MHRLLGICFLLKMTLLASDIEWDWDQNACPPDHFFATVGHFNATKKNFEQLLRDNERLIVAVSSSACRECCPFEKVLHEINTEIFSNPERNFNMTVKIARIDLAYEPWYQSEHPSGSVPDLHYFKGGVSLHINEKTDGPLLMEQIYKIENWFEELGSLNQIFDFLDPRPNLDGFKRKRVLCVVPDSSLFEDFNRISENTFWRLDIKYGLVRDQTIVDIINKSNLKLFKAVTDPFPKRLTLNLRSLGFDNFKENHVYLVNYKNKLEDSHKTYSFDAEIEERLDHWFISKSFEKVEEISKYNQAVMMLRSQTTIFAFLDMNRREESQNIIRQLESVVELMPEANFVWSDWNTSRKPAMSVGMFRCENFPCISLALPQEDEKEEGQTHVALARKFNNYVIMPDNYEKTSESISSFISLALFNKGDVTPGLDDYSQSAYDNYRAFYVNFSMRTMSHSHLLNEVLKNERDYIVFFVSSYSSFDQQLLFEKFQAVKEFFKKADNINPILFVYDFSTEHDLPDFEIEDLDVLITTSETKEGEEKYVVLKKPGKAVEIIIEYLKKKEARLEKAIQFTPNEKSIGITYQAIFEGQI
jgi:hypothetical protein